ncbi:synaptic vesicle 2-related protein-like [Antennarius striatus]|uniref:synaptic vesicle 2-related protein-like n=1 Tax=Antennarius striatus TaxID=241820 RepID=UPI0035B451FF
MDCCIRPQSILYKRWRNPPQSSEERSEGWRREDMSVDNKICTIAPGIFDAEGEDSSNSYRSDEAETLSVEDVLETIGFGIFQWKLCFLTGLAWTGESMEIMILSVLGPQLHCDWRLSSFQVAFMTSVVFLGMASSSPVWGNMSDKYGRKICLIISICWSVFYGILSAFAPAYGWLLVLRGLVGVGFGGGPQTVTLYSEFLPMKMRGISIMMMSVFWSVGAVFEVLLAWWIMPTLGWRWLLIFSITPFATFICFCSWLPESPRFDLLTGNTEKAMATLQRVARDNGKTMPEGKVIAHKQKDRGQIKDLLSSQYWRTTLLLWFIWFANVFSYFGIIMLTTTLLQSGGSCGANQGTKPEPCCNLECNYLTSDDYKDLLWTTLAEFPGVLFITLIIDRIGRTKSMATCFFMLSLFILPLYACIGRISATVVIFIARAFICGGLQVVFVYTPEVYPTENRALAMGTCSAVSKFGSLIAPFVSEVMLRKSMYLTLSIYCGCSLLAGIMCLILPMETSGKSLQESTFNKEAGANDHNNESVKNTTLSQD